MAWLLRHVCELLRLSVGSMPWVHLLLLLRLHLLLLLHLHLHLHLLLLLHLLLQGHNCLPLPRQLVS